MFYLMEGETATTGAAIKSFVQSVIGGVTSNITIADVGTVLAAIIGAGIVAMFAWKFGRKGFAFLKNVLSGKAGRV